MSALRIIGHIFLGVGAIALAPFLLALAFVLFIGLAAWFSFVFNITLVFFIALFQAFFS
jgi:hypothetical protein